MHNDDKPMREVSLVDVEITEITHALGAFKIEVVTGAQGLHFD